MWSKIGTIALKAGKIYIEKRGIDGVIEDASKVTRAGKKLFSKKTCDYYSDEDIIENNNINDFCAELSSLVEQAQDMDILSEEFYQTISSVIDGGYAEINSLLEKDPEMQIYTDEINSIDSECNNAFQLMTAKCRGTMEERIVVSAEDYKKPFKMEVYGLYQFGYVDNKTFIVGIITQGCLKVGDEIIIDNELTSTVNGIYMFSKEIDEGEAGDVTCILIDGDFANNYFPPYTIIKIEEHLEVKVKPEDTENSINEQEYLNELKECFEDDYKISNRERHLLDSLRKSLKISDKRANELEVQIYLNNLTPNEQEYADELKSFYEDGKISDREHRLLDKVRKSLNISEERALKIQQYIQKD